MTSQISPKKIVLVTGVSGYWGARVAQALTAQPAYHVIGLDGQAPAEAIPGLDFIQADIHNPLLVDLLELEQVDVVYHLAFKESARPSEAAFSYNVMGSMQVLGACAQSSVRQIILKSSTAVYGAKPRNPAFLNEQHPLNGSRAYGSTRDLLEIEALCKDFRRQSPQIALTILRFANIIGPTANTPIACYLNESLSPSLLGFDPMMQLIHEDDVVAALAHAIAGDFAGVFNIAAEDLMPLSKVIGLAGKLRLPVFHPLAYWGNTLLRGSGLRLSWNIPMELDYIRYRWVADLQRMRDIIGFIPAHSAAQALSEFASQRRRRRCLPDAITRAADVDHLRGIIESRRNSACQSGAYQDLETGIHE